MKNLFSIRKQIFGVILLTILGGAPFVTATAHAAPDPNPGAFRDNERRNRDDRERDNRDGKAVSFDGVVINVRSDTRFEVRASNGNYTVDSDSSLPRGLREGDKVRVTGRFYDNGDVRHADVSLLRNDGDRDENRGDNSYRTYRGSVAILLPNNEFNARIDGRMYKVYALESTRDLRVGDPISIYGQLEKSVDIRNARVTVEKNRDSGRDNRDRDNSDARRDYETYSGEVTNIISSREFDIITDGRTYNVYADKAPKRLNRGDEVRVTGRRVGTNDIRDAKVKVTRNR